MRVLIVNKFARVTGGADRNCLAVGQALRERGHAVAYLSTGSPGNVVQDGRFIRAGVTHANRDSLRLDLRLRVAARALWNLDAAQAMRRLVSSFQPDVVHVHKLYPQLSVAPVLVASRAGLPVVQTLHDYEMLSASHLDHSGGWVDRDETTISYRALNTVTHAVRHVVHAPRVNAWIACSRFVAARFRACGVTATVLPYFVERPPARSRTFAERRGAVFVGRLHREKGVLDVLALAKMRPSLEITMIGHGPLEDVVSQAARQLTNLTFLGRLDQAAVVDVVGRAHVLLMPSLWQEPGGIAALEAMSVGTPVVAYDNGGLAEYVADAGGGRVVAPTVQALAIESATLISTQSVWTDLSGRGMQAVADAHSAPPYLSRLEHIYRAVVCPLHSTR